MPLSLTLTVVPSTGAVPLDVVLTGIATGGTAPYLIIVATGDGGYIQLTPTGDYSYTTAGIYTAVATVTDFAGNTATSPPVTVTATAAIRAFASPPPALNVYQEDPENVFNYDEDWEEKWDSIDQPGGGAQFTAYSGEATLVGSIPWNKRRSAMQYFLGWSYCDTVAPYALHRIQPPPHPDFPQLRVAGFACTGFAINTVPVEGEPPDEEDDPPPDTGKVLWEDTPFTDDYGGQLYTTPYQYATITLKYKSFGRQRFWPDSKIGGYTDEWQRNCTFTFEPGVEALGSDVQSNLTWAEGQPRPVSPPPPAPPVPPNTGPPYIGTSIPAPISDILAKTTFKLKWWNVPVNYVSSDPGVLLLDKIVTRIGTVNNDVMFDSPDEEGLFQPGMMLLLGVAVEEVLFPVAPLDPTDYPVTGCHITFHWQYFNPKKGVPGSMYYGHDLQIWRGDGLAYYCTRASARTLVRHTDHMAVFSNVLDPTTSVNPP